MKIIFRVHDSSSKLNSEAIDSELLENLREYLKTRSQEEISEIFEEIRKILENRASENESKGGQEKEVPYNEKVKHKRNLKGAFRIFSKTASCGKKRIINVSKVCFFKSFVNSIRRKRINKGLFEKAQ